jgi:acyl-CoA reductase-like NAD-dependent aldehyde dehydrogenase
MQMEVRANHLIAGMLVDSPHRFAVIDPATEQAFADCPDATRDQLDAAVAAAQAAFPGWRACSIEARRATLHAFATRLRDHAGEIAPLLTREQGKPLAFARAEVLRSAEHIEALSAIDLSDETLRADGRGRIELRYRPLGVVGAIAPWNAPVVLAMHKVAQALYTGNCVVLKPSPYTPLATLAVAALAADLFPRGVLNVIAGGNELGAWISSHPGIDKISFTGSVATGRRVMASAGEGLKRVTLELGGNDAAIVREDADLDAAAAGIAASAFANCGQICMAVKRVYAAAPIHDALVERIATRAAAIRYGPGNVPGTEMGPIQNRMHYDKVRDLIAHTRADPAARFETGADQPDGPGYFVAPTVVTGLGDDARLVREEQFGPVLPILSFEDEEEATRRANDSDVGLGGSVWSRDLARAAEMAGRIDSGMVWINRHGGSDPDTPFGGAKDSGIGWEQGVLGLRSYMQMQVMAVPA